VAGYNWEHLMVERNCELAASFGIFIYRFTLFVIFFFFFFFLLFFVLLVKKMGFVCSAAGP
jgi:hypothetical protein